jgi:hypothetical protein
MGIYNGVWEHLYRRFISGKPSENDRTVLIPGYDDVNTYEHSPTVPNFPSRADIYTISEKDSIND